MLTKTSKPLRVLIASRSFAHLGGVVNYVRLLLQHTNPSSVDFEHLLIAKAHPKSPNWQLPLDYLGSVWRFFRTVRRTKPDVFHVNISLNWTSLPLGVVLLWLATLFTKTPVLVFFRGWKDEIAESMIDRRWYGRVLAFLLSKAEHYLVLSHVFKEQLVAAGFPEDKITVTPVMVETHKFQPPKESTMTASSSDTGFTILSLGRLARPKGIRELMDAMIWLEEQHPNHPLKLIIAGDGPERSYLEDRINRHDLHRTVEMVGRIHGKEKSDIYQKADLFVFPSYHEGFPNVIVEALSAGLPIIYTPVGALEKVLTPNEHGIRVELEALSGEVLGQQIWALYSDSERRGRMAKANRELATSSYDVSVVCSQMANIYQKVVAGQI